MGNKMTDIIVSTKLKEVIRPIGSVTITIPFETAVRLISILGKTINEPADIYKLFTSLISAGITPNYVWQRSTPNIDCGEL